MYNNAIRSAAIKTSNGTYNTRGLGAEAENVVISRDANGNIIEDLAPATVSTTESLATTVKNLENKTGIKVKQGYGSIVLDHNDLIYESNVIAGMYTPTLLPELPPYVLVDLLSLHITQSNDFILSTSLNSVICHFHYQQDESIIDEYRQVPAIMQIDTPNYGGQLRIIFLDKEWIEAFNPSTYSGQGEVSVEIEFSILYTDESPY